MLTNQVDKLVVKWIKTGKCSQKDREIVAYGVVLGIEILFFVLTTLVVGIAFKLIKESIIFLLAYRYIRIYSGGFHCETAVNCYLVSSSTVIIALSIIKLMPIKLMGVVSVIFIFISVLIILKCAPIEAKNKPLDEKEKTQYKKTLRIHLFIECFVAFFLIILNLYVEALTISLSIVVASCMVLLSKLRHISRTK